MAFFLSTNTNEQGDSNNAGVKHRLPLSNIIGHEESEENH